MSTKWRWQNFARLGASPYNRDMKSKLYLLSALIVALFGCVRPVVRMDPQLQQQKRQSVAEKKALQAKAALPDLKKTLWVLPFTKSYAAPGELERYPIPNILQVEIFKKLGENTNPFLLPLEDQRSLKEIGLDSSSPLEDLIKIAQGSAVDGFLKGDITEVSLKEEDAAEGMLRTRKVDLIMKVHYELYDAISGQKVTEGDLNDVYSETRSDVLNVANTIVQPRKKLGQVAAGVTAKMIEGLTPYSAKLGWSGKILKIESNRIFLDAGRRTGIVIGDILKVMERERNIYDPDSGGVIGQAPGRLKGTVKVVQYFGLDGSIAILQSGGDVFPGDRIELY